MMFAVEFGSPYQIIDTDYTDYAIVYSCSQTLANSILMGEYVWFLSRTAHVEGTSDFNTFISNMQAIADVKLPNYDYNTMMENILHGTVENSCQYAP